MHPSHHLPRPLWRPLTSLRYPRAPYSFAPVAPPSNEPSPTPLIWTGPSDPNYSDATDFLCKLLLICLTTTIVTHFSLRVAHSELHDYESFLSLWVIFESHELFWFFRSTPDIQSHAEVILSHWLKRYSNFIWITTGVFWSHFSRICWVSSEVPSPFESLQLFGVMGTLLESLGSFKQSLWLWYSVTIDESFN